MGVTYTTLATYPLGNPVGLLSATKDIMAKMSQITLKKSAQLTYTEETLIFFHIYLYLA